MLKTFEAPTNTGVVPPSKWYPGHRHRPFLDARDGMENEDPNSFKPKQDPDYFANHVYVGVAVLGPRQKVNVEISDIVSTIRQVKQTALPNQNH